MARKTQLAAMTWKEAEEAFRDNPVIIVPNASIEQHGPQTPVGDYRVGEIVAERIAAETGAIVAPMLPFGYSEAFRRFPGTVTLRAESIYSVMRSEEHTSELQSRENLVCRLLLEKKKKLKR